VAQQTNVSPGEHVLEIPLSEFQGLLKELADTYNQIAETIRDAGILRGRELARLTEDNSKALKAERSPTSKFLLLNAYIRQLLTKIRGALKGRLSPETERVIQVCSKIMARAIQIIDYIKTYSEGAPTGKRDISLDSQQARLLFSGKSQEVVSRRDAIRAMRRAEKLWPALACGHRPNDGRMTMRLTISREDLECGPEMDYCSYWQRSNGRIAVSL
jgi:hypothetical protein